MSLFRTLVFLTTTLASAASAFAHVVPNMTVEMDFARNRGFTMRVNFDPRLFLSDRPTELPPVPAEWYRDQSQEEQEETRAKARAYLRQNLKLVFGADTPDLPTFKIEAIDGRDNQPLKKDTEELHLLATAVKGSGAANASGGPTVIPFAAKDFRLQLGSEANVSLVLLTHMEGQKETVPAVVFPGETSPVFELTGVMSPEEALASFKKPEAAPKPKQRVSTSWIMRGILSLALLVFWALFLKKRRSVGPPPRRYMR